MRSDRFSLGLMFLVSGCALVNAPTVKADYDRTSAAAVIVETWNSGFVPEAMVHRDVLTVYGDGHWQATKAIPSQSWQETVQATGSISSDRLDHLLDQAFLRVASQRFVDLPARLNDGVMDAPTTQITLGLRNASQSVVNMGTNPTFDAFHSAIASETVSLPLP